MGADRTLTPIDLRRAGPGWTVHFRCGGQATVEKCLAHPNPFLQRFLSGRRPSAMTGWFVSSVQSTPSTLSPRPAAHDRGADARGAGGDCEDRYRFQSEQRM